ncbi:hypothetical protein BDD12DRAFT_898075 [Trichophaea hybrida]|nr:hypothetical protein BDD12DRAFT_898075 [Trichophaea hybrida]
MQSYMDFNTCSCGNPNCISSSSASSSHSHSSNFSPSSSFPPSPYFPLSNEGPTVSYIDLTNEGPASSYIDLGFSPQQPNEPFEFSFVPETSYSTGWGDNLYEGLPQSANGFVNTYEALFPPRSADVAVNDQTPLPQQPQQQQPQQQRQRRQRRRQHPQKLQQEQLRQQREQYRQSRLSPPPQPQPLLTISPETDTSAPEFVFDFTNASVNPVPGQVPTTQFYHQEHTPEEEAIIRRLSNWKTEKHRREEEWKAALLEAKRAEDAKRMPPPPRPMGLPLLLQPKPSNVMPPPPSPPSVQVLLQQRPPSPQLLTLNLKGTSHKPDMEVASNKEAFALLADPQPQPGTVQTELLGIRISGSNAGT